MSVRRRQVSDPKAMASNDLDYRHAAPPRSLKKRVSIHYFWPRHFLIVLYRFWPRTVLTSIVHYSAGSLTI